MDAAEVTRHDGRLMEEDAPILAMMGGRPRNVDTYVTGKALNGLFTLMAQEEKKILRDPVARTPNLLRKVSGSAAR